MKEQVAILKPYSVSSENSKHDNEFFARTELHLIERFEDKAYKFLLNILQHSSFRETDISRAIELKDYTNAKNMRKKEYKTIGIGQV